MFNSSICCSGLFSFSISNDGDVYSCGYSSYGTHGHEERKINIFTKINHLHNIKSINCSLYHSICLDYNGCIYSFGKNGKGQLGIGKTDIPFTNSFIPQKVNLPSIKKFSCGENFTICVSDDDKLYSFGFNNEGQLGLGNNDSYNSPQLIPALYNIEFIVCGTTHAICKTYNNEFYSWGYNGNGQLGKGNNERCNIPIQCKNWPDNIIDIKSGFFHSLLLTEEGQVYSFGSNLFGQLGINNKNIKSINTPTLIKDIPEIQRIECGPNHSKLIDINSNLWVFGKNYSGQLGLGDKENRYKPILHPTLSNIIDISSGGYHTFVKTIDNKIYAFGLNDYAQLGIKTIDKYQLTPIQVLEDQEDIWCSTIGKSRAKSARK